MATRILVVNDTQDILEMFRLLLEAEGYEVIVSSFPLQDIFEIEKLSIDLIILDVVFGQEKTGWQMLQLLKMHPSTASIPIIICSASQQAVQEQEGYLVSKNVLVVYKPFELEDLLHTITQALQSRKHVLSQVDEKKDSPHKDKNK